MIIGAQKCGTTALAHFLGQHPQIRMSSEKEPHLFDAEDYSRTWSPEQIDNRYRPYFASDREETTTDESTPSDGVMRGEATPIYLFLPEIAAELRRYNPNLKVIVLLRDPVERAISHYYMEKNRGCEKLPLWLALLFESWRTSRCVNPRRFDSAWRVHTYRRRGLFSLQLRNLLQHFDAGQVELVRAEHLARHHDAVLKRMFRFLGVDEEYAGIEAQTLFEGERGGRRHTVVSWLLRVGFLLEFIRMRRFNVAEARE